MVLKKNNFQLTIKTTLFIFALIIIVSVIFVNRIIIDDLRDDVKKQLHHVTQSYSEALNNSDTNELTYMMNTLLPSLNFPIIIVSGDEIYATINVDISKDDELYQSKIFDLIKKMDSEFEPFYVYHDSTIISTIHYGDSKIIDRLSVLPYIEISFAILFLFFSMLVFQLIRSDEQNSIYVGMAKETAHQLGTPISSLMGWVEIIKENNKLKIDNKIINSIENDIDRLSNISDRFSKIGSNINLKEMDVYTILRDTITYMKSRLPKSSRINITMKSRKKFSILGNKVLLAWAFENLIKNAIDAIEMNKGKIQIRYILNDEFLNIYLEDNGKGIARKDWMSVFKPGYSTKKRGWGLGLSLTKRIISDIHNGSIVVSNSRPGKTIFLVKLPISNSIS